ncbi:hypothetical protein FH039_09340 [Thermococcus indicus]|uniref:Ribbon-helix-helix protein CopG domain-containing protein n=1 Tax=Thermococcus indicus TaxID=2586643 RepID=A0A4Y5SN48_9EURY|nr:hypothetical protein [Thermococcus indicus]QDA31764.1 hypothetical protein FH039_09340 [Thermococcus indicus]
MSETKVVQTEVDMEVYRTLKAVASAEKKPLKEIIREILRDYAEKKKKKLLEEVEKDPIWEAVGLLETNEEDASERDDWGVPEW